MSFDFDIDAEEDWFFNTDPICDFPNFKKSLTDMGIQIGTAGAWRSVGTVDVLPEDIGERILFEDGGIFYIDDEGVKRRGFMYRLVSILNGRDMSANLSFTFVNAQLSKTLDGKLTVLPMQNQ